MSEIEHTTSKSEFEHTNYVCQNFSTHFFLLEIQHTTSKSEIERTDDLCQKLSTQIIDVII